MIESGNIHPAFMSSISVVKIMCCLVRLVHNHQAVVLSYQLLLKLAEFLETTMRNKVRKVKKKVMTSSVNGERR